jgi:hypothetical protein
VVTGKAGNANLAGGKAELFDAGDGDIGALALPDVVTIPRRIGERAARRIAGARTVARGVARKSRRFNSGIPK